MYKPIKINNSLQIKHFYTIYETEYKKDYIFSGESHNFYEIIYLLDGELCLTVNNTVSVVKSGNIIVLKPLEFHKFYAINCNKLKLLITSFALEGDLHGGIFSLDENEKLIISQVRRLFQNSRIKTKPLVLEKAKFISYKRCMNDPVYSQQFKNCLENLILEISRKSPLDSKELKNNDTAVFADAVHYMTMNIDKNISISEIADECCISLTRLKYIFNKFCSTGIHKYFLNLKLSKACEMLSGGLSIGEIAEKLNFSSQNYFSIVFKREFGISPTEFKKEQQ